jgi:hypothetical protein
MHDIQNIRDVHPNLPVVLGNVDLNHRIQANTPIDGPCSSGGENLERDKRWILFQMTMSPHLLTVR